MTDKILKSQAFKLKGRLYTLTVLSILETDKFLFSQQLSEIVSQAPRLFKQTPIVLDCSAIDSSQLDLQAFCQSAREHGLIPVAVQGGNAMLETLAQCQGLAVVNASSNHDKWLPDYHQEEAPMTEIIKTKLITTPVRSGQQIVSPGDLVITAAVSHGAELLADGNIHVYGALRGRALAGINGNKDVRIFCQSLEAELVSIAGYYRLSDAMEPIAKACQVYLQDDHIQIEAL
ncbi:septum site-determining protein MinC [Legionella nagasakiensis]|uniref:septum site-determining protein MinC n=1 Tax=Legionella nagasakiensis TaxID=535290 RepID=UPI001054CC1D|nr:septum site-determining protein MinC [Legionella nagasakiensis]